MTEEIKFAIETYPGFRFIPSDMPAKIEVTSSIYDVFKKRRMPRKFKKKIKRTLNFVVLEICHYKGNQLVWCDGMGLRGKNIYGRFLINNCIRLKEDDHMFINLYKNSPPIIINKRFILKWFKHKLSEFKYI